jgi:hypothetical protein
MALRFCSNFCRNNDGNVLLTADFSESMTIWGQILPPKSVVNG